MTSTRWTPRLKPMVPATGPGGCGDRVDHRADRRCAAMSRDRTLSQGVIALARTIIHPVHVALHDCGGVPRQARYRLYVDGIGSMVERSGGPFQSGVLKYVALSPSGSGSRRAAALREHQQDRRGREQTSAGLRRRIEGSAFESGERVELQLQRLELLARLAELSLGGEPLIVGEILRRGGDQRVDVARSRLRARAAAGRRRRRRVRRRRRGGALALGAVAERRLRRRRTAPPSPTSNVGP